ncbi:MAG: EI24 domain-containing protein [Coraliomargarita sp.]
MRSISDTKFAFQKAHEIIWDHGQWKFLLVPILLTALLLPALGALAMGLSYLLGTWVEQAITENGAAWIRWLVMALIATGTLSTGYVLYRNLIMVCYAPFLDQLTVQTEKLVNGQANESNRPLLEALARPLVITVYAVTASLGTILVGLLLGLIPFIGGLLMMCFLLPTQLFLGSVGYVDPYLERQGLSARESIRLMRANLWPMLVFAAAGFLILMIPIVGWFVAPTYSAVAGIVFGILMCNKVSLYAINEPKHRIGFDHCLGKVEIIHQQLRQLRQLR